MAKSIAASSQKKPGGLSDKVSDIVLVVICAAVMLIVAYPLYYILVASFSVLAYDLNVDLDTLKKLRVRCVKDVKEINGGISFDKALEYQKGTE